MSWFRSRLAWVIDSGVSVETPSSDARYVRFINATLLLFVLAQLPVLSLLFYMELETQVQVNLGALALLGLAFVLNRRGAHLVAKIVIVAVMSTNTAYFAWMLGSSTPVHFWLIPGAVLGVLAFKPSEWMWALMLVGFSLLLFILFEFVYTDLGSLVQNFNDPEQKARAAQGSTLSAMLLTLIFVGMMHRRFARSERALSEEKARSESLLRAILPTEIANQLRDRGETKAERHEDVSILFADIVGFTPLAASMPPEEVVALLAEVFARFDALIETCGVEKIKTIGDAYMVAGGVPQPNDGHPHALARCALGMLKVVRSFSLASGYSLRLRIGLHRGPVVAGVIGTTKFAYDLWGESVNMASRLESSGEPGRIQVSEAFMTSMNNAFIFEERGEVELKGVGSVQTYWLLSER